jgi:exosome complex RNA-binding protein Rrp42 (RNase PH superfamily)
VTICAFGTSLVVDATESEERHCDAKLIVSVNNQGKICFSKQVGKKGLAPQQILNVFALSKIASQSVIAALNSALEQEERMQQPKKWLTTD